MQGEDDDLRQHLGSIRGAVQHLGSGRGAQHLGSAQHLANGAASEPTEIPFDRLSCMAVPLEAW